MIICAGVWSEYYCEFDNPVDCYDRGVGDIGDGCYGWCERHTLFESELVKVRRNETCYPALNTY